MEIKKKILLLGYRGMLGHMAYNYLYPKYDIIHNPSRFPTQSFKDSITRFDGDFIINCIGSIPQKTDEFDEANYDLVKWIVDNSSAKVIHPGSDCEIENDPYGKSKRKASDYIKEHPSDRIKILKTSIIGPEHNTKHGLLEWFLSQEKVFGYVNAMWNGNTTLEWSKEADNLMENWDDYEIETVLRTECISKFDLLNIIKKIFYKNIEIEPREEPVVDRCLSGGKKMKSIEEQLVELKQFYYEYL